MNFTLEKEDKIISIFLKSIGPWNQHEIISGGFAPIIYKLYLSDYRTGINPIGTRDLDSIISPKVSNKKDKKLLQYLLDFGFKPIYKDLEIPATESYIKEIEGFELEIEFLTSANFRGNNIKNVQISGINAQPLKYLELSYKNSIEFTTRSNKKGLVVSPDIWIFHKGLTFSKRFNDNKKCKDLYGIWYVATQLGEFSANSIENFKKLEISQSKWFQKFKKNLFEWMENASPLHWTKLESQDPYGKLNKTHFIYTIDKLI